MKIFDEKFKQHKSNYFLQPLFATIAVAAALFLFDIVDQPMIVASFGASAFIIFTRPHDKTSSSRHVIGGYIIGIIVGSLVHLATFLNIEHDLTEKFLYIMAGGLAVLFTMFFMVVTNTEHAPAVSVALGLVINTWRISIIGQVILGIVIISLIHHFLKKRMVDLM